VTYLMTEQQYMPIGTTAMDRGKKRSYEPSKLLEHNDRSRNERIRHHDELMSVASVNRREISYSSLYSNTDEYAEIHTNDTCPESEVAKNRETKDERRETNRLRARHIRKKKKKMEEELDRQLVFLTIENNKLRAEGQMQRAELSLLRNITKESTKQNAVQPLTNSNDQSCVSDIGNDVGSLLRFLPASNSRNSATTTNPEFSSSTDFGISSHRGISFAPNVNPTSAASRFNTFQLGLDLITPDLTNLSSSADSAISSHHSPSFAPNANVASAASRIPNNSFRLGLPTVESILRANPNIVPSLLGSSSLQIPVARSSNDNNSMTIPTESRSLNSNESIISRIDDLILSLLRDGQQPNSTNR